HRWYEIFLVRLSFPAYVREAWRTEVSKKVSTHEKHRDCVSLRHGRRPLDVGLFKVQTGSPCGRRGSNASAGFEFGSCCGPSIRRRGGYADKVAGGSEIFHENGTGPDGGDEGSEPARTGRAEGEHVAEL